MRDQTCLLQLVYSIDRNDASTVLRDEPVHVKRSDRVDRGPRFVLCLGFPLGFHQEQLRALSSRVEQKIRSQGMGSRWSLPPVLRNFEPFRF